MIIEVKNRMETGDRLEVLSPKGNHSFEAEKMIRDDTGNEGHALQ